MKRALGWIVAAGVLITPLEADAQEDAICAAVQGFIQQAARGEAASITLGALNDPSECSSSLFMSGARSNHCAWAFDYRAPDARQAFEQLAQQIAACPGATLPKKAAKQVNHPDSYDQQTWRFEEGGVSLSLKDKAARQQTYIFLRTLAHP